MDAGRLETLIQRIGLLEQDIAGENDAHATRLVMLGDDVARMLEDVSRELGEWPMGSAAELRKRLDTKAGTIDGKQPKEH